MKQLLVLRHAKSSWKQAELDDHERPLNRRGLGDAPRMGRLLRKQGLVPELTLSSTAVRALTTARLVLEAAKGTGDLCPTDALYGGEPQDWLRLLTEHADPYERVMVVGHNPGLEEFVELLTGEPTELPTATVALIHLPVATWAELDGRTRGELCGLWKPKELGS